MSAPARSPVRRSRSRASASRRWGVTVAATSAWCSTWTCPPRSPSRSASCWSSSPPCAVTRPPVAPRGSAVRSRSSASACATSERTGEQPMPTTPPGFLILDDSLASAVAGEALVLEGDEGRHAAKVARIGAGEQVLLTDALGRQVLAEVTAARKEALDLRLLTDPSPAVQRLPRLTLVQALATGGRDEQAVESATELGVAAVVRSEERRGGK